MSSVEAHPAEGRATSPGAGTNPPNVITRAISLACNAAALGALAVLAFGWLWPVDLESTGEARLILDSAAFFIRTLALQIAIGLVPVAILVAVLRRWRAAIVVAALSLGAAWPTVRTWLPETQPRVGEASLRVLSVNLLAWNATPELLANAIAKSPADVILLQEYSYDWHRRLGPKLGGQFPNVAAEPREGCFGTAIYSRRPFTQPVDSGLPIGETGNSQQRAVVQFGGREVALYNIHLLPPLGRSYIRPGRREAVDLAKLLASEPLPAAVAGDFNFTNSCAQADRLFSLGFRDSLDEGARGPQWSWPAIGAASGFPGIRLDHVYINRELRCTSAEVLESGGSDHRPVLAELRWAAD